MSKPRGKCVFCNGFGLTRSHIWPEWSQKILPSTAARYEITVGDTMETFTQTAPGPPFFKTSRPGSAAKRQPRNTCLECNSGWMRSIEEAAKPIVTNLIRGRHFLLTTIDQRLLATFLCLISMRIELSGELRTTPQEHRNWLISKREPPPNWWISFCRYQDNDPVDYWFGFLGMARASLSEATLVGAHNCNTQVTTIIVGNFCAHLFSSTVWDNFRGYDGASLAQIWPPNPYIIDTEFVAFIDNSGLPWLHEAVARDGIQPE